MSGAASSRPALHDRDFGQIYRIPFQHFLLARRATCRRLVGIFQHLLKLRQLVEQIAEAFRWLRLFQKRQLSLPLHVTP